MTDYPDKILLSRITNTDNAWYMFKTEEARKDFYEKEVKKFAKLPYDLWIFNNDLEASFIGMTGTGPFSHAVYLDVDHYHYKAFIWLDWYSDFGIAAPLEKYNLLNFEIDDLTII